MMIDAFTTARSLGTTVTRVIILKLCLPLQMHSRASEFRSPRTSTVQAC